jgi:peptidoglycan lytic transglycosylase
VLVALAVVAVIAGAAGVWVVRTEPEIYLRARYPLRYESIIRSHARSYDLDPTLLAAVVYTESRFNPSARSSAGAVGLMQLLPDTAKGIAVRTGGDGFVLSDLLDPEINVRYGSWYLRSLLRKYGGDVSTALAAYHAGQGNVDRWRAEGVGIQFPETRHYVAGVLAAQKRYARAYPDELGG